MSTSGSTNFNLVANQIIDKAFHRLGKASEGEAMSPRMYEDGRSSLNLILKRLGTNERLFLKTEGSLSLVADQEGYTLTSPFPLRIQSVRRRHTDDTIDTPLREMSRQEYFDLPTKSSNSGTPVAYYFDPQRASGVLYVWPPPSTTVAADNTLRLTYLRRIEDMDSTTDDLDMPQEWLDSIVWLLADDLETEYPVNDARLAQKIERKAAQAKADLDWWDTEGTSIYFQPEFQ